MKLIFFKIKEFLTSKVTRKEIGVLGLVMGAVGGVLLALSVGENPGGYVKSVSSGIEYHVAIISSMWLNLGLSLIILGFIYQALEKILDEKPRISNWLFILMIPVISGLLFKALVFIQGYIIFR